MTKKTTGALARAANSKIGRICHFTHPDTGEIIEGVYQRGRRVKRTMGGRRLQPEELTDGAVSGFMFDEQVFTVPSSVKISMGMAPAPKKGG